MSCRVPLKDVKSTQDNKAIRKYQKLDIFAGILIIGIKNLEKLVGILDGKHSQFLHNSSY